MFGLFNKTKDPVCGMSINKKAAKFSSGNNFFCSQGCRDKFDQDPKKYSAGEDHGEGGCCH